MPKLRRPWPHNGAGVTPLGRGLVAGGVASQWRWRAWTVLRRRGFDPPGVRVGDGRALHRRGSRCL
jgi:hypothetical protein